MKKEKQTPNVEFGNEFGDINAAKLYDITLGNNEKKKDRKQKKTNKK